MTFRKRLVPFGKQFNLFRYFAVTAFLCFALIAFITSWFSYRQAKQDLIQGYESHAESVAMMLNDTIADQFVRPKVEAGKVIDIENGEGQFAELHTLLVKHLEYLSSVERVKIYDTTGRIVYSDDRELLGVSNSDNSKFQQALSGEITSVLLHKEAGGDTLYEKLRKDLLEVYVPVKGGETQAFSGVFEIYVDVTPLYTKLADTQKSVALGTVGILSILYVVLLGIVYKGEKIIRRSEQNVGKANEELARSEERYRKMVETAQEGIMMIDANARTTYANKHMLEMMRYEEHEFIGKYLFDFVDPEKRSEAEESFRRRKQGIKETFEMCLRRSDGSRIWVYVSANPVLDDDGGFAGSFSMITDISALKRTEEALHQAVSKASEERSRFEGILGAIGEGISVQDTDFRILYQNQVLRDMAGDHVGEYCYKAYRKKARVCEGCHLAMVFQDGNIHRVETSAPVNGETKYVEITGSPLRDTEGRIVGGIEIIRDITDRKKSEMERQNLEEQFRQAQKMEAVGKLAGGIAHDFNNLLTVISGYTDLLLNRLRKTDPLRGEIDAIRKAGEIAAGLTRQLLAFSRRQVLQPKSIKLNEVIANIEDMVRRLIGEDIELRTLLEEEPWDVRADPGQIEQVILNLVVNSRDAMAQGGTLTIETKNVDLDATYAESSVQVKPGPYVMIAVSDTGCGMNETTKARVFEPFFTTKEPGKGTGLGLSTVYGIVKQSRGYVWASSEPGVGTTFRVYLPRLVDSAGHIAPSFESATAAPNGEETVLLVEDEELVREMVHQILRIQGYTVLVAGSGDEAVRIVKEYGGPIHLLLTDVVMPQMSGPGLAGQITDMRPEVKVLYMSGYTEDTIVHQSVLDEGVNFIQKPFKKDVLGKKIREVLDRQLVA